MFPTAPVHTASDTTSLTQGAVSTSFATITKTATITATTAATNTTVETAYRMSTVTMSAKAKYTATHLRDVVPPNLLENVTAVYAIVSKKDASAELYAVKWALGAALITGASIAWHMRHNPPPPPPPGIERLRWKTIRHHVHVWLHRKLRSDGSLRRELEDARKKLEESETSRGTKTDHASQTEELTGEAEQVQGGILQQTMDFNRISDQATSLRQELETEKVRAAFLQKELQDTQQALNQTQCALKGKTQELKRTITRVQEARMHTDRSEDHDAPLQKVKVNTGLLEQQLDAALRETEEAKNKMASKELQMQKVQVEASQVVADATSLQVRLDSANRKRLNDKRDLDFKDQELLVARQQQGQANSYLRFLSTQLQSSRGEVIQANNQLASKKADRPMTQISEQQISEYKAQLAFSKEELELAQTENEMLKREAISKNTKLQEARQEAKEAHAGAASLEESLEIAKNGLETVTSLLPDVQAQVDALTMQLEASRKGEVKGRENISSLEGELGETRLEHSMQVVSLQEQLKNPRRLVMEKDALDEEEKYMSNELMNELEDENEDLKEELGKEAARRKKLETEVKKLHEEVKDLTSDSAYYTAQLQTYATDYGALEKEVEKLQSETDVAKTKDVVRPPPTSFTSSGTQTLPTTDLSQGSLLIEPIQTPNSPPKLLSVAGGIIPSTPRPNDFPAASVTPLTTSTPNPDKTPESVAIAHLFRDGKINLSEYVAGLTALPSKSNKRKPDDAGETPRPVKKLGFDEKSVSRPIVDVFTPGGGPAFKLWKQASGGGTNVRIVLDGTEAPQLINTEKIKTSAIGLDNATSPLLFRQDTVEVDKGPRGDMPPILMNLATKRKLDARDGEESPKPSQALRTEEDIGDEQTLSLDELMTNTASPTTDTSFPSGGPSVDFSAQEFITPAEEDDRGEAASLNDSNRSEQVASAVENKDFPPEALPTSAEPGSSNDPIVIADNDEAKTASITGVAKPAPAQATRRESRLPKSVPTKGTRKSSRNASKLAVSLNEQILSKRSVSPLKDGKVLAASPPDQTVKPSAKSTARPRARGSPSKARKNK